MSPDLLIRTEDGIVALEVKARSGVGHRAGSEAETTVAALLEEEGVNSWRFDPDFYGRGWGATCVSVEPNNVTQTVTYGTTLGATVHARADHLRRWNYSAATAYNDVARATEALDATDVAKLLKAVKTWRDAAKSSVAYVDGTSESVVFSSAFVDTAIADVNRKGRDWLYGWSIWALPRLLLGNVNEELVELVRDVAHAKRSDRALPTHPQITRVKSQLMRLANAIVPHAPPIAHLFRLSGV
jgi:hypothetical protein